MTEQSFRDKRGVPYTASSQDAVDALDASVEEFMTSGRDAGLLLARLAEVDPEMVMGQVLRGYFLRLPAQPALAQQSLEALAYAEGLSARATSRERAHVAALRAWCEGDILRTNRIWDDIVMNDPRDLLALRISHTMHFFLGDLKRMRDAMSRVMPYWNEHVPGYGFVLGCRAFSLEENGEYAEAEQLGRQAVAINEADIWAGHAVAHVLESLERREDGIAWIDEHEAAWRERGKFAHHLWWHRSLHYLELERYHDVLNAYDREFWREPSNDNTDICNASSILMRLHMLGVDVGDRWQSVADVCEQYLGTRLRPFNDLHYQMALAMSGRFAQAEQLIESIEEFVAHNASERASDALTVTVARTYHNVGLDVARAILAFARGQHGQVVELMRDARYLMLPLGGSWAQRDVWVRMLIFSALADGQDALARGLLSERVDSQPQSAPSQKLYAQALTRCGETDAAAAASARARALLQ